MAVTGGSAGSVLSTSHRLVNDAQDVQRPGHRRVISGIRLGNCHGNALAERCFQPLEREPIRRRIYGTRDEARSDIFEHRDAL